MKVTLPETLKADLPVTIWSKILSATPVVMAVVATMLAGLASSEMTRAQYDRSYAAQLQSKAGDQWNYFQGKKLRGALQRTELDLLASTTEVHPLDRAALLGSPAGSAFDSAAGQQALTALVDGKLPEAGTAVESDASVQAALAALDASRPDAEVAALLARVDGKALEDALRGAQARALAFDAVIKPLEKAISRAEKQLAGTALRRDFVAARLSYAAARYDADAGLNQTVASLYDLQVQKGNQAAERHHSRSQKFFYGMLVAQMGVIISTLAMAARKRNLLWSVAAGAGAVAIAFAIYVYLCV